MRRWPRRRRRRPRRRQRQRRRRSRSRRAASSRKENVATATCSVPRTLAPPRTHRCSEGLERGATGTGGAEDAEGSQGEGSACRQGARRARDGRRKRPRRRRRANRRPPPSRQIEAPRRPRPPRRSLPAPPAADRRRAAARRRRHRHPAAAAAHRARPRRRRALAGAAEVASKRTDAPAGRGPDSSNEKVRFALDALTYRTQGPVPPPRPRRAGPVTAAPRRRGRPSAAMRKTADQVPLPAGRGPPRPAESWPHVSVDVTAPRRARLGGSAGPKADGVGVTGQDRTRRPVRASAPLVEGIGSGRRRRRSRRGGASGSADVEKSSGGARIAKPRPPQPATRESPSPPSSKRGGPFQVWAASGAARAPRGGGVSIGRALSPSKLQVVAAPATRDRTVATRAAATPRESGRGGDAARESSVKLRRPSDGRRFRGRASRWGVTTGSWGRRALTGVAALASILV